MDMKCLKPYNQRLIALLQRALTPGSDRDYHQTISELNKMIADLKSQNLNLFELVLEIEQSVSEKYQDELESLPDGNEMHHS